MKKLLLLFSMGLATTAQAQEMTRQQMREVRSLCQADMRRLCPNIKPGDGKLMACVEEKAAELSEPCANALMTAKTAKQKSN